MQFFGQWNILKGKITPFLKASFGWTWVDSNIPSGPATGTCWWDPWWGYVCTTFQDTKSLDGFTYGFDAGARYNFSDTIAVRASYRMMWVDLSNASGTPDVDGFRLGLNWRF